MILRTLIAALLISSPALAGPRISEGEGPVGSHLQCESLSTSSTFEVRPTAAYTITQGLYLSAHGAPVSMLCEGKGTEWKCDELSNVGEGQLHAHAYKNSQGVITAQIYRNNIAGQQVTEESMLCRKP